MPVGMQAAYGFENKWCFNKTLTIDGTSKRFEIHPSGESLSKNTAIINTAGTTGDVGVHKERNREDAITVQGTLNFHVSAHWLQFFLPHILGNGTVTAGVHELGNTLDPFWCMIHRKTRIYKYNELYVNKATFKGRANQFIDVALDVIGVSSSNDVPGGAITFPSVSLLAADAAMLFKELTFEQEGDLVTLLDFELSIDNKLAARYGNSASATDIARTDNRVIMLNTNEPFNADNAADFYAATTEGLEAILTLGGPKTTPVSGVSASCVFDIPHWVLQNGDPTTGAKSETPISYSGQCERSLTVNEMVTTLTMPT